MASPRADPPENRGAARVTVAVVTSPRLTGVSPLVALRDLVEALDSLTETVH